MQVLELFSENSLNLCKIYVSCFPFRPVVLAQIPTLSQKADAWCRPCEQTWGSPWCHWEGCWVATWIIWLHKHVDPRPHFWKTCARHGFSMSSSAVLETPIWQLFGDNLHHIFLALLLGVMMPSHVHDGSCSKAFVPTTVDSQCICFNSYEIPVEGLRQTYSRPELGFKLEYKSMHL